ncbi:RagB/SusD family nutrient uptake outer membrane protein [Pontibacter sp. BT731]|uniref:RagB/SusD family nutrient uptake outer membrane protein n=1 Tax=Pontibacter coccineus TaxID=3063328 RepID=UPI0026E277EB|nr:RagB/SusD family nutrient uptake outer membrane protein [Pontibacter sp. BT731]MDO6390119.1 RagB/SusD family nutrient uptake outer membrane protein [Pontibacter sp. BT731]
MKNRSLKYLFIALLVGSFSSCNDSLDVEPKNKVPAEAVLSDPNGIRSYLANMYYELPVEDFVYFPRAGFNARGNTGSLSLAQYGLEAIHSEWPNWNEFNNQWWTRGYQLNRDINLLEESVGKVNFSEAERTTIEGEIAFLRAYTYYGFVKRYGGVPIITENQSYSTDWESLRVPRKTEKETWDFVLTQLDIAFDKLPENRNSQDETKRRATKWAAAGLKSRVALHAASVAKYWNRAPLSGQAVDAGLVGMPESEANRYYQEAIKASEAVINSGRFGLYMANPSSPQEAAKNYQKLFMQPNDALTEVLFMKGYGHAGGPLAHDYDGWNNPNQTGEGFPHVGRTNPVLELVDRYENYEKPGEASPIVTTANGQVQVGDFNPSADYIRFSSPEDIFQGKDARFFASVIHPGAVWKGTEIVIQGGVIRPDGSVLSTKGSVEHKGTTYHAYGAATSNQYSGFDGTPNMTRTGFLLKKFLDEGASINTWLQSTTDFIDIRYAEVLLNHAEAVAESGQGNADLASQGLNAIRRRAGHTVNIPLTLENVLRERAVELAFENKEYWDLIRRRTYHQIFNNYVKTALVPMLDLRGEEPAYIYIRKRVPGAQPNTFPERDYYSSIPGVNNNGVIQNPQH